MEIFADWCGPSDAVLSTVKNNHVKMMGRKIKWYQANTKEIAALEKYADDAKPRFLFYRDGEVMEAVEAANADLHVLAFVTLFVPTEMCDLPEHGTIVYHPSLLPLHRGAS